MRGWAILCNLNKFSKTPASVYQPKEHCAFSCWVRCDKMWVWVAIVVACYQIQFDKITIVNPTCNWRFFTLAYDVKVKHRLYRDILEVEDKSLSLPREQLHWKAIAINLAIHIWFMCGRSHLLWFCDGSDSWITAGRVLGLPYLE